MKFEGSKYNMTEVSSGTFMIFAVSESNQVSDMLADLSKKLLGEELVISSSYERCEYSNILQNIVRIKINVTHEEASFFNPLTDSLTETDSRNYINSLRIFNKINK